MKKHIASAVVCSFFFNNVLLAHVPQTTIWAERRKPDSRITSSRQQSRVPSLETKNTSPLRSIAPFSIVRDSFQTGNQPPLLIIQDIHLNSEAQSNVVKMLEALRAEGQLKSIATEGASGAFNFRQFFTPDNLALRRKTADKFLAENRIAASSYFGVTASVADTRVTGVDDDALYEANVQAYLQTLDSKQAMSNRLEGERAALEQEKARVFNTELLNLDRLVARYDAGQATLGEMVAQVGTPTATLRDFREASRLEKTIDFDRVDVERKQVLERLASKLSAIETETLVQMSLQRQSDEMKRGEYYGALKTLLARHGIALEKTPAFAAYLRYTLLADGIDGSMLLKDARIAIQDALEKLAVSDRERELLVHSRRLTLQEKLTNFVLTPEEWREYQVAGTSLGGFEDFYRIADLRSEKIVANTLKVSPSVLIIGGFHTDHVTQLLKERGVSYVVLSPKITKIEGSGSEYLSVFQREKSVLEKLFAGKKLTVLPAGTLLGSDASRAEAPNKQFKEEVAPPAGWTDPDPFHHFMNMLWGYGNPPWIPFVIIGAGLSLLTGNFWFASIALVPFLMAGLTPGGTASVKSWVEENTPGLVGKDIYEVTMELALSNKLIAELVSKGATDDEIRAAAMASSTGGIGPLLNERVAALSELGANVVAVSLLYEHVYLQRIKKSDDPSKPDELHLEKVYIGDKLRQLYSKVATLDVVMYDGTTAQADVYKAPAGAYGPADIYLLANPNIANVVYPGRAEYNDPTEDPHSVVRYDYEKQKRLQQNWFLGRGVLGLSEKLERIPEIIVQSEMPTVFTNPHMFMDRYQSDPRFKNTRVIFNDHTPLGYAHPKWQKHDLDRMKLDRSYYEGLPNLIARDKDGKMIPDTLDGTAMMVNAADAVYGVAEKHARVMRNMPTLKQFAAKIQYITNGVGKGWEDEAKYNLSMTDQELLDSQEKDRVELVNWLARRNDLGDDWAKRIIDGKNPVGVWTRRVVGYKRLDTFASMLHDPDLRKRFLDTGIVFVFGGRIHQDDTYGQTQFWRIQNAMMEEPLLRDRVIFFHNYNTWEARQLLGKANFSVMLADDGQEAAATGFQKAQKRGKKIIFSPDGATLESVFDLQDDNLDKANGFLVPYVNQDNPNEPGQKVWGPTPAGLLSGFERFAAVYKDPKLDAVMTRNALKQSNFVGVERTAQDMARFFENLLKAKEKEADDFQRGWNAAISQLTAKKWKPGEAAQGLQHLKTIPAFTWMFDSFDSGIIKLRTSDPGMEGFIDSFRRVRSVGTLGEYSILYHAENHGGAGDIVHYLGQAFRGVPQLVAINRHVNEIGNKSTTLTEQDEILALHYELQGYIEGVVAELKKIEERDSNPSPAPGALWPWVRSGLSFKEIGFIEGVVTTILVALAMSATLLNLPAEMHVLQKFSLLALIPLVTVSSLVVIAKIVVGVFKTGLTGPARDPLTVFSASWRAFPSVAGIVMWTHALVMPFTAWTIIVGIIGLVFLLAKHPLFNDKFDAELEPLSRGERKWVHELNYLQGQPQRFAARINGLLEKPMADDLQGYSPEAKDLIRFARADIRQPFNLFLYQAALEGRRSFRATPVSSAIQRGDNLLLVPKSRNVNDIVTEILAARKLQSPTGKLMVSLPNDNQGEVRNALEGRQEFGGIEFVYEAELSTSDQITAAYDWLLGDGGDVKLVMHASAVRAGWSKLLVDTLFLLKAQSKYENRLHLMIVNQLVANVLAVEVVKPIDMEAAFKFLETMVDNQV